MQTRVTFLLSGPGALGLANLARGAGRQVLEQRAAAISSRTHAVLLHLSRNAAFASRVRGAFPVRAH